MSAAERKRLLVLAQVKEGKLSLAAAAGVMGVGYRQAKRIWRRFRAKGDAGLVHRGRGRAGPRAKAPDVRKKILARYAARYPDFGPTLAAEHLARDGFKVDHETLRRWLVAEGKWQLGRPRRQHRAWRERRECFGQMVQMDGSEHDWFEGRRARAVLMVMVDDATGCTYGEFFEGETTHAAYDTLEGWIKKHGVPASLYVDRDSIYRCERVASVEEQVAGEEPRTQFGRAMEQLGVKVIMAHSPQAKGRVERRNGILQDRLIKEMRLAGISTLAAANAFLRQRFWPAFNKRFQVAARNAADAHSPAPAKLDEIFSWEKERTVTNDWTARWGGQVFQIAREEEALSLPGRKVILRRRRNGQVEAIFKGRKVKIKLLPEGQAPRAPEVRRYGASRLSKPAAAHPWRVSAGAIGGEFWKRVRRDGAKEKQAHAQAAAASGQPPLRSGFPAAAAA